MKRTTLIYLSFPDINGLFNRGGASIERIGHVCIEECHAIAQAELNQRADAIRRALAQPELNNGFNTSFEITVIHTTHTPIGEAYDWAASLPTQTETP